MAAETTGNRKFSFEFLSGFTAVIYGSVWIVIGVNIFHILADMGIAVILAVVGGIVGGFIAAWILGILGSLGSFLIEIIGL